MGYYTSLSDRYGRKFLMHLTLIPGLLLQALIYYMSRPTNTLGLWVIYVSAVFKGLTGAGGLLDPALSAYLCKIQHTAGQFHRWLRYRHSRTKFHFLSFQQLIVCRPEK